MTPSFLLSNLKWLFPYLRVSCQQQLWLKFRIDSDRRCNFTPQGATALAERYHIFSPEKIDAKRDQNSLILASREKVGEVVAFECFGRARVLGG